MIILHESMLHNWSYWNRMKVQIILNSIRTHYIKKSSLTTGTDDSHMWIWQLSNAHVWPNQLRLSTARPWPRLPFRNARRPFSPQTLGKTLKAHHNTVNWGRHIIGESQEANTGVGAWRSQFHRLRERPVGGRTLQGFWPVPLRPGTSWRPGKPRRWGGRVPSPPYARPGARERGESLFLDVAQLGHDLKYGSLSPTHFDFFLYIKFFESF